MNTRLLGSKGPRVSAIGLGCMAILRAYGPPMKRRALRPSEPLSTQASLYSIQVIFTAWGTTRC